jgi:hypothetical protein
METKFKLLDTFFYIIKTKGRIDKKCEACEGKSKIIHNGHSFICQSCNGNGKVMGDIWEVEDRELTVHSISLQTYTDIPADIYYMTTNSGTGNCYREDRMFKTIEEALTECKRRNKEYFIIN